MPRRGPTSICPAIPDRPRAPAANCRLSCNRKRRLRAEACATGTGPVPFARFLAGRRGPPRPPLLLFFGKIVAWLTWLFVTSLVHLDGAQLGAARRRVLGNFSLARLKRMFGQNGRPCLASQLPEFLFHFSIVRGHECDDHRSEESRVGKSVDLGGR